MRKLLNNPWIVGALTLIATVFVVQSLAPEKPFNRVNPAAATAPAPVTVETTVTTEVEAAPLSIGDALKEIAVTAASRDPFAPQSVSRPTPKVLEVREPDMVEVVQLSALWSQDGRTLFVLNGQLLQVGEEIGRMKIESANQDGVWLNHWKGRDFLTLGSSFTLTTPANGPPPTVLTTSKP